MNLCPFCDARLDFNKDTLWKSMEVFKILKENNHLVKTPCCGRGIKIQYEMNIKARVYTINDVPDKDDWGNELNK